MNEIYSSGQELKSIKNKDFAKYDTTHAREIVLALDKCGIPYFARFNDMSISLTFDKDYTDKVSGIVSKANSDEYEELLLELNSPKSKENNYSSLLPEIAKVLNTAIGSLAARPPEVIETLCKTYVNNWICDENTVKAELENVFDMKPMNDLEDSEPISSYISKKYPEKVSEYQHKDHEQIGFIRMEEQRRIAEQIRRTKMEENKDEPVREK